MWADIQAPLFFGVLAAFVTTIGLIVVAQRRDWSSRYATLFALAAGGMLLTLTLLHIAPEALERTAEAPALMLGGFLGGLVINYVVDRLTSDQADGVHTAAAVVPLVAIGLHSFLDGVIYAVTFAASFEAGAFTALSLILHEFPEGVIAFAILRAQGVSNRASFIFAFLAAALTTPFGVAASAPFVFALGTDAIGGLFAVSAGLLLFVATGPLMAPLRTEPPVRGTAALAAGVVFALGLTYSPLNAHRHSHGDGSHGAFHAGLDLPHNGGVGV